MRKSKNLRFKPDATEAARLARLRGEKVVSEKRLLDLRYDRERGLFYDAKEVERALCDLALRLGTAIDNFDLSLKQKAALKSELKGQFFAQAEQMEAEKRALTNPAIGE